MSDTTKTRTLNTIRADRELLLNTRTMLEKKRAKLEDEIGELNKNLTHLEIQEQRLMNLSEGNQ